MKRTSRDKSVIALIDGEHYPPVVVRALSLLESQGLEVKGLVFLGGTEKVSGGEPPAYGDIPLYWGSNPRECLRDALREQVPDMVVDLTDEPVVGYRERFELICLVLAQGISYRGCDFLFHPHTQKIAPKRPSIGIWGLGKRVGKTAISGYMARYLKGGGTDPCIVAMGRGGPSQPEVLEGDRELTCEELVRRSDAGDHAASDHYEDALMSDVTTVGCWRCGGGMVGEPCASNLEEGARVAEALENDLLIFEGSGAAIPPVRVDAVLLAVSALQPREYVLGYLGPYRLLLSDVIVVTMCEKSLISEEELLELEDGIMAINPRLRVVRTAFRPRPLKNISGKRVFLASTASGEILDIQKSYLEEEYDCRVVGMSPYLSDRAKLKVDIEETVDADTLVTELKAAAVDVVSRAGVETGREVVYLENFPVSVKGNLEAEIDYLERIAWRRFGERQ